LDFVVKKKIMKKIGGKSILSVGKLGKEESESRDRWQEGPVKVKVGSAETALVPLLKPIFMVPAPVDEEKKKICREKGGA